VIFNLKKEAGLQKRAVCLEILGIVFISEMQRQLDKKN
jgi:hypothetical protein